LNNDLKAALNLAFVGNRAFLPPDFDKTVKFGLALTNAVSIEAIEEVSESQILKDDQIREILAASQSFDPDGDFCRLVVVLAATGTRFSQAKRILVKDVQVANSRILVPQSWKGKKTRVQRTPVPVGADVLAELGPAIEGRSGDEPLLQRWHREQIRVGEWRQTNRVAWKTASEMTRDWNRVVASIGLSGVTPYALRHSSIVRGIRAGLPIRLVAAAHDTSVQMIERHYSRWITDGLEELTAQAVIPLIG
jgi:integrase